MEVVNSPDAKGSPDLPVVHREMANAIRALAMDAVEAAKSGHPGMPLGMADVATVLFTEFLRFDPEDPNWPDRDRFVLSAGHGSMLLYALLYLTGYSDMTIEQIKQFRQLGSRTAGHPEFGQASGIETTTGPLGQGFANAVGMAMAERHLNARFGDAVVSHNTYVVASDGDLMEGISHEAASLAGHLALGRLIVLFDDNGISIDGPTSLAISEDVPARFAAYGWAVQKVDGHDPEEIAAAIRVARDQPQPSLIACRTRIGYGAPKKEGTAASHGAPLGPEEVAGARERLGWSSAAFEIPPAILTQWRTAGQRGRSERDAWAARLAETPSDKRNAFQRCLSGNLPDGWLDALAAYRREVAREQPKLATRVASQKTIEVLHDAIPELIGGSADLTGSVGTKVKAHQAITPDNFAGRYLHYGVREHAMAAAMNGMALHGGVVPYGGTFLVFSDYCRPAIRLAALSGLRVIFVMTHDSIGLGEDGPTHQPIEQLAGLRAMPNLRVFRPADALETAECWELALNTQATPSVMVLSRQGLPLVRRDDGVENLSAFGAYILSPASGERQASLLATGSEVAIALEAQRLLGEEEIAAAVVSMPSWELFAAQPAHYQDEVLGASSTRIAIEAAAPFGWERWVGTKGAIIGMTGFGASAPAGALYQHFNITAEAVAAAVKQRL